MADTDLPPPFDPNVPAVPAGGEAPPPFDPNKNFDAAAAPPFDPNQPHQEITGQGNALTDVWPEEKRAAAETLQSVKSGLGPSSTEQTLKETAAAPFWDITPQLRAVGRAGSAIGSALAYPFQAVVGAPARSLLGHPLAAAEETLGTNIDPQKLQAALEAGVPKDQAIAKAMETPQQTYERWRGNVDTALSAVKPRGAPVVSPADISWDWQYPAAPVAPQPGPFGVTLSKGEEANDLAARIREKSYLREGSRHAQDWAAQREGQLAEAPQTAAAGLDAAQQVIANTPQAASDIVSSALNQHQGFVDSLIKGSEQGLTAMHESLRAGLSPTGTTLARDPLEAANVIQGAVANEAERAQQAKSAAYAALDNSGTEFHPAAFNNAADKMRAIVEKTEKVDINPDSTPISNRVLSKLDSIVQDVTQQRDPDTGRILTNDPITPSALEEVRKRLNVFMGEALASARMGKPSDAIAMRGIIDAWDSLIEDRIVKGTVTKGNPLDALSQMRYARGLNTVYRQTFMPRGPGDDVGQAIQKILGRYEGSAATPEQIQGMLYSPTNPLSVRIATRFKNMFGEASPEFGAAKQGFYSFLTERPAGGEAWGPEKIADRIDQYTQGPGRTLTQAYLNPDEIAKVQELGQRLRSHARGVELAENPFEGVDFNAVFRRAMNQDPKAVGQLEEALNRLGPSSPHASALRQGLFLRAVQPLEGVQKWGPKSIGDNLASLLASTRNSPIYSAAQRDVIKSYIDLMRKIEMPHGTYAPSEPAIRRAMSVVGYRTGQIIGAIIGRAVTPGVPLIGEFAGITVGGRLEKAAEAATLGRVKKQLPLVAEQLDRYQKAYAAWQKHQNPGTQKLLGVATSNLANNLRNFGIDWSKLPLSLPGTAPAQNQQQRAAGGGVQEGDDAQPPAPFLSQQDLADPDIIPAHDGHPLRLVIRPPVPNALGDNQSPPTAPEKPPGPFNGAGLGLPSGGTGKGLEQASEGDSAPIGEPSPAPILTGAEGGPPPLESTPSNPTGPQTILQKLFGVNGPRYQLWPERLVRSGTTLAGDVMSGQTPIIDPVTGHTSEEVIQRAQDMAALAGGAGMPAAEEGALGMTGGKLTPAVKYEGKIYKGPDHETIIDRLGLSDEEANALPWGSAGFVNHKGHYLTREKAVEYALDHDLVEPEYQEIARRGGLAAEMLRSDTSKPGAALSALAHTNEPLYSAVEHTIANASQQKMQASQWANWLRNQPGIKKEELGWLGLDNPENLPQGLVTRDQLLQHAREQGVGLQEVEKKGTNLDEDALGEEADRLMHVWEDATPELSRIEEINGLHVAFDNQGNIIATGNSAQGARLNANNALRDLRTKDPDVLHDLSTEVADNNLRLLSGGTKYSDYQLPGGENYRELLLTKPTKGKSNFEQLSPAELNNLRKQYKEDFGELPDRGELRDYFARYQNQERPDVYHSSHWDEPNVIAHLRMNDRDIPGVGKSLHLEELQSDWHQQGRKHGYQEGRPGEETGDYSISATHGIPDAPFKQTWPDLLLKRAIAKAVHENKDAISWTPGEQQAARYDLSKHVDTITWDPKSQELRAFKGDNKVLTQSNVAPDKLADYIGKDAADRIVNKPTKVGAQGFHFLEDNDLKVGGEGMRGFYDKMLVDKANAIGKKFGAKVEWKDLNPAKYDAPVKEDNMWWRYPTDSDLEPMYFESKAKAIAFEPPPLKVPVLRITPQLREQVLRQGLPLFARGGKVAAETYNEKIPRPISHQQNGSQPEYLPERAAGGRVNPANINSAPTEAQKSAGNYSKDTVHRHGFEISVENAKGSKREGIGKDGRKWSVVMPAAYGYLKGTVGKDKDHLDVYLGPHTKAPHVFIIDQIDKDTKKFDEHKIGIGWGSKTQFIHTYKKAFSDGKGAARIGAVHSMTLAQFKDWVKDGDTKAPFKAPERKKLAHKTVGYVAHSERPNRHCSVCVMFLSAEHGGPACTLVSSPIDPGGWCRHFRRRT